MLSEFIRTADEVINAKSDNHANFRFAHAETIIPFVALMGIRNADVRVADPDSVSVYWKDYEIAPMAANIQWIFCHDEKGEILGEISAKRERGVPSIDNTSLSLLFME